MKDKFSRCHMSAVISHRYNFFIRSFQLGSLRSRIKCKMYWDMSFWLIICKYKKYFIFLYQKALIGPIQISACYIRVVGIFSRFNTKWLLLWIRDHTSTWWLLGWEVWREVDFGYWAAQYCLVYIINSNCCHGRRCNLAVYFTCLARNGWS